MVFGLIAYYLSPWTLRAIAALEDLAVGYGPGRLSTCFLLLVAQRRANSSGFEGCKAKTETYPSAKLRTTLVHCVYASLKGNFDVSSGRLQTPLALKTQASPGKVLTDTCWRRPHGEIHGSGSAFYQVRSM